MAGWTPITPVSRGPRQPSHAEEPAAGKTKGGGGGGVFRVQENSHCNAAEKQRDFKQRRAAAQQKQRDLKNSLIDKLRGIVPPQGGSQDNSKRAKHAVLTDTIALLKRLQSEPNNQAALTEWQNGEANGAAAPDPSSDLEDGDATVAISAVPGDGDAADEEIEMELARQRKLAWGRIRGFAMGSRPPPPRPAAGQASGPKRSRPATQGTPAAKRHRPLAGPALAEAAEIAAIVAAQRRRDVREAELKSAELASLNVHFEALRQVNASLLSSNVSLQARNASLLASNVSLLASNAQKDEQLQAQQKELDARQEKLNAQQMKLHAQQEKIVAHLLADSDLRHLLSREGAQ